MGAMNFQRIFVPVAAVGLTAWSWQTWGWLGVAMVVTGGVMWVLLYFTRLVHIMKRALLDIRTGWSLGLPFNRDSR